MREYSYFKGPHNIHSTAIAFDMRDHIRERNTSVKFGGLHKIYSEISNIDDFCQMTAWIIQFIIHNKFIDVINLQFYSFVFQLDGSEAQADEDEPDFYEEATIPA